MAVTVNFKTASKRVNSTGVVGGDVTAVSCNINEPCSIENPQIILRNGGSAPSWNYCEISEFGRSYWVEDWEYRNNTWIAHCVVDVLATYRDTIQASNLFFIRSSTSFDGDVMDTLYPTLSTPVKKRTVVNDGLFPVAEYGLNQGYFVCGIVGEDGLTNFYAFIPTNFADFCSKIFSTLDWANISGQQITDSLLKCLFNPFQYLTSVMWFPCENVGAGSTQVSEVKFGFWSCDVTALKLGNKPFYSRSFDMPISQHPQVSRGTFLNASPFRRIQLTIDPWGTFDIDGGKVASAESVTVSETIDCMSGVGVMSVSAGGVTLYSGYAQIGVNIQVSDLRANIIESGSNLLSSIGNLFSGNFLGSASGVANAVESAIPDVHTRGVNGTLLSIARIPFVIETFYKITDEDRADNGRPYMKNGTMQELGAGYYVVENGSINVQGATRNEKEQIKQFLEGGVFYA